MSDENEKKLPPDHQTHPTTEQQAPAAPDPAAEPAPTGRRFRDRVLGVRSVAAVALASLILGGVGGAAVVAVTDGGDHGDHGGRPDRDGRHGQFPGRQFEQGGVPGQLPPSSTPDQDDSGQTG